MGLLERIFGNTAEKELKRLDPIVKKIESYDKAMQELSDEQLRAKTDEFKKRLADGETLDDLLPEAYAVVREATDRVLHTKHFRVQLVGGVVLHQGRIAEMRTGEGKTQVCLLPAYLNALEGKGVHVVTVNDYLANRDAEWMGQVHRFLGLTVGCILNDMSPEQRKEAYSCDITYGTNNEFGFDYLRDNMIVYKEKMVQRGLHYAIIDEVDSVLIDEARTPLIISGRSAKSTSLYQQADLLAERLQKGRKIGDTSKLAMLMQEEVQEEGDFIVDEKEKSCVLTAQGVEKAERYFKLKNLSDPENAEIVHHINIALKARYMMFRDKDYVVKDDQIVIVDEFTGRLMPGRRYSDGLHQAIEAKERVEVKRESKTLATITFQNYFNKYDKKAGMTGTAKTEENEFQDIYGMDVVEIPTNRPVARKDHPDMVFKTKKEKYAAAIEDIKESYAKGQPVLVGTITIEDSELVSHLLKREGIPHDVLNAKNHEREANIVAQAGQKGMITIATNMAGRGTDIKLGEGVKQLGGLKIIGTERHESRRIDNQLRGRAGRQGDPGESRFYISMEDDLMRIFGGERMKGMLERLRLPEGQPISDKTLSSAIERSQKRVEENNFGIRKRLLEYDQINNSQREIIYDQRRQVLEGKDMRETMMQMLEDTVHYYVTEATKGSEFSRDWNLNDLNDGLRRVVPFPQPIAIPEEEQDKIPAADFEKRILNGAIHLYEKKEEEFGDQAREIERVMMLRSVDQHWTEHIDLMDQMRQTVGMQSYAQKNPLDEYRMISYDMFEELSAAIKEDALKMVYHVHLVKNEEVERKEVSKDISTNRGNDTSAVKKPTRRAGAKIMPNDPCPCGSGMKYKFCHGKKA